MHATLRARTLPYRPALRSDQRVCTRCGIVFPSRPDRTQHTECRDCR